SSQVQRNDQSTGSLDCTRAAREGVWTGVKGTDDACSTTDDDGDDGHNDTDSEDDEDLSHRPRIARYQSISPSAAYLSRQLGRRCVIQQANDSNLWQQETANFYSLPEDVFSN